MWNKLKYPILAWDGPLYSCWVDMKGLLNPLLPVWVCSRGSGSYKVLIKEQEGFQGMITACVDAINPIGTMSEAEAAGTRGAINSERKKNYHRPLLLNLTESWDKSMVTSLFRSSRPSPDSDESWKSMKKNMEQLEQQLAINISTHTLYVDCN